MALAGKSGFFFDYYLNLKNNEGEKFEKGIEKILTCHNEFERMAFVDAMPCVSQYDQKLQIRREFEGKNADIAADLKEKGNLAFKAKKWLEAMVLYTKSFIALPADKIPEQAIILANRSATLYHMQKFDESLIDIKRSINLNYPKNLIYKLYDREARCYLAKKIYPKTIECFKKFITAMDDAGLPSDKKSKMQLDAMTMIKMLERDSNTKKQAAKLEKLGDVELSLCIPDEKEFLSPAIRFDQNRNEGRFARAATDLKVGMEILVEKPFVAALLEKFSKTHCENCFIRTAIPVACPKCADVVYCSEKCLNEAQQKYHKNECGILPTIWRSGASINCHMAYRAIASKPMDYFLKMKDLINEELSIEDIRKYVGVQWWRNCGLYENINQCLFGITCFKEALKNA